QVGIGWTARRVHVRRVVRRRAPADQARLPRRRPRQVQPYNAEAITVDFENKAGKARKQINEWTRQVTRGLINSVLPPGSIGLTTAIVLGNAIYQEEAVLPPRRRPRRAVHIVEQLQTVRRRARRVQGAQAPLQRAESP
uniref:Serpin domain-containing protein n=1 Tax=Oryza glaberrima TaxID=4538 RepID=I1QZD9_ORYGL